MAMTPDEEKVERDLDRQERNDNRRIAESQSKRTVFVGVLAGVLALAGGLGKEAIDALKPKEDKPAFAFQLSAAPFDTKSRVGVLKTDLKKGTAWYSRTNAKGEIEWALIGDAEPPPLAAIISGPPGGPGNTTPAPAPAPTRP